MIQILLVFLLGLFQYINMVQIIKIILLSLLIILNVHAVTRIHFIQQDVLLFKHDNDFLKKEIKQAQYDIINYDDEDEIQRQAWIHCLKCPKNTVIISHDI